MIITRLCSPVVLLALVGCGCSATARGIAINGAEHGFAGAAPADLERACAAMMQWRPRR